MSAEGMEEQAGPSRQGYCGYCSLIYTSLDQHVSSARHRDRVRLSSRSSSLSSLMERFLEDVLLHHPHRYADTRPSHADLPSPWSPLVARPELAELSVSNDDDRSLGTSDNLSSSDPTSCLLVHPEEVDVVKTTATHSQSERLLFGEAVLDRSSLPITEHDTRQSPKDTPFPHSPDTPLPHSPVTAPSIHRKCHRKTDRRRKCSSSSSSSSSLYAPLLCSTPLPGHSPMPGSTPLPPARLSGCSSPGPLKGETESFHFSLSASQRTGESDSWDTPVQAALERRELCPQVKSPPTQLGQSEAWKLTCLTESHIKLDDQVYARQLDSALRTLPADSGWSQPVDSALRTLPADSGRGRQAGYRCLPIEEVRPHPPYIPESFRGKTLAQIECEDEQKVESLVQQFRHTAFLCYFDTETLASPARLATPASPASKRCRRRSRPLEAEGLKVRYKPLPVRWYDPAAQRVLGSRPHRLPPRGNTVARQLFRSLSPDLNAHGRGGGAGGRGRKRRREEKEDGTPAVKVHRSSSDETPTFGRFPLGTLRSDPREHRASRGRGRRKGGRSQTPGRGRGRRRESREAYSCPRPRRRGGQQAGELRKVPGSEGPLEASARSLRVRRKTGCPCCN
ncbi:unnamed protein product [Lota lota]